MIIMDQRCPRCAIRRTADLRNWGYFCFNCRLRWCSPASATEAAVIHAASLESPPHPFGPRELLRLERYRAAIQAGFFTDWPVAQEGRAVPVR